MNRIWNKNIKKIVLLIGFIFLIYIMFSNMVRADDEIKDKIQVESTTNAISKSYKSSYDSRNYINNIPVYDQGDTGTCYAQSALLQLMILCKKSNLNYSFSRIAADIMINNKYTFDDGGYFYLVGDYTTSADGLAAVADYNEGSNDVKNTIRVLEWESLEDRFINVIKKLKTSDGVISYRVNRKNFTDDIVNPTVDQMFKLDIINEMIPFLGDNKEYIINTNMKQYLNNYTGIRYKNCRKMV